ncbi:hypothetical protein SGRA_2560 [Saprospira grandis str. Lewin]|uniref:Uncharacterized protein n=1 Tax=Saprospira grandis (strain Lewin) TaxID=984262 RepID=H6L6P2_SAPGL|nr:hypothetical protein SGRA_2560 [Saprospira grandis str. Lewin]
MDLGPPLRPAALRRYALGLALCSALRQQAGSVWPDGHPAASLGRSSVFFLLAFFFGGWVVLGPWAEALGYTH